MTVPVPEDIYLSGPLFAAGPPGKRSFFIDTSTLIYLDRIALLEAVCQAFAPATIGPVLAEFGRMVADLRILPVAAVETATDDALFAVTCQYSGVLLSDDGGLLRRAARHGLWYYNTLMLISGLCYHGVLAYREGEAAIDKLFTFARYSHAVRAYGRTVLALAREHEAAKGVDKESP